MSASGKSFDKLKKPIFFHGLYILIFFLLGLVFPVILAIAKKDGVELISPEWFQRGGASMTMFALLIDKQIKEIFALINPEGFADLKREEYQRRNKIKLTALKNLGFILALLGTLVWGYGDIIAVKYIN